jgi:hypothetical protein
MIAYENKFASYPVSAWNECVLSLAGEADDARRRVARLLRRLGAAYQKSLIMYIYEGLGVENVGYFMAIRYILLPFGMFLVIWYMSSCFGMLYQEKSGNPVRDRMHMYLHT